MYCLGAAGLSNSSIRGMDLVCESSQSKLQSGSTFLPPLNWKSMKAPFYRTELCTCPFLSVFGRLRILLD